MRVSEIRTTIESLGGGPEARIAFSEKYVDALLDGIKLPNDRVVQKRPEDFSIRALWEGLIGDVEDTLPRGLISGGNSRRIRLTEGAIDSSMFPTVTGNIIMRKVIEGYNMTGLIGDQLVERMQSNLKSETIPGFTDGQAPKEVAEGDRYEEASFGEKYVTTETSKKGRLISLTEEDIIFDKTGQLLVRSRRIGENTAVEREETILNGITGTNANVYKPGGTATTLYAAGNNNLNASTSLTDWSSIDTVIKNHAANVKTDPQGETGKPIIWMPRTLLVHTAQMMKAARIVNATEVRETTNTNTLTLSTNPVGGMGLNVLATPLLPGTNTDWYLGDFTRQFIWQEIWPIQTFVQGNTSESSFERDIVSRYKVRYYGGIAAMDTRYVVKNTA